MFGNLVGYGEYGFVYEDETEINGPDGSVIKIMNLNNLCNLQQYNMFKFHKQFFISSQAIPKIALRFNFKRETLGLIALGLTEHDHALVTLTRLLEARHSAPALDGQGLDAPAPFVPAVRANPARAHALVDGGVVQLVDSVSYGVRVEVVHGDRQALA